jgi:hypothetical protein
VTIASIFQNPLVDVALTIAVAICWVVALVALVTSKLSRGGKVLWAVVILVVPLFGAIAFLLASPSKAMDFDVLDKPMSDASRQNMEYEMTHRPLG